MPNEGTHRGCEDEERRGGQYESIDVLRTVFEQRLSASDVLKLAKGATEAKGVIPVGGGSDMGGVVGVGVGVASDERIVHDTSKEESEGS